MLCYDVLMMQLNGLKGATVMTVPTVRSHNVQAIVPQQVHETLRDVAYKKGISLRDLIRAILTDFTTQVERDALTKQ